MKMLKIRPTSNDVLHTIFGGKADDECVIDSLPKPYKFTATPFETNDFDPTVREASVSDKDFGSCMRVSKVIVVGDVAVGKTCLVKRFCHKTYDMEYKGTLGVDFEVQRFDILNAPFSLQLWDTAGQERFKSIASSYYRGAHAIVLTFDVSRMYSLQAIPQWLEETMQYNEDDPLLFMVGTKLDIPSPSKYALIERDAINMALALKAEYWAVSSKTGENVHDFFCRVAALTFSKAVLKELEVGPPKREISNFASLSNQKKEIERKRGCRSMCSK